MSLEPPKIKSVTISIASPSICHDVMGIDAMILVFCMLSFIGLFFLNFISALLTMPKPLTEWITTNWKILKEMGILDHLTCLLRNLYTGQEAIVRTEHGIAAWFQIGKRVWQGCILSSCLFNLHTEYIMRNAGWDETQARIKNARRNISNLR